MGTEVRYSANKQTAANADWLIGEGIFMPNINSKALRSMKDPGSAYDDPITLGKDPQPGTMAGYVNTDQDTAAFTLTRAFRITRFSWPQQYWVAIHGIRRD